MPELPAVEYSRRLLEENVVGKRMAEVRVEEDPIIFEGATPANIRSELTGRRVISAHRYGKYLWLALTDNTWLLMHFGMTGFVEVRGRNRLYYKSAPETNEPRTVTGEWPPRFTKLEIIMSEDEKNDDNCQNGEESDGRVRFVIGDSRRLGRIRVLHQDPHTVAPVKELGFDPLLSMPPCDEAFRRRVQQRAVPLKSFVLDQSFAAGVGNWMADDIMLEARLHPERRTDSLSEDEVERLHKAIIYISKTAVAANADGSKFPAHWLFHCRWPADRKKGGKKTTSPVEFLKIGGRTTAYIPSLQKRSTISLTGTSDETSDIVKTSHKRSAKRTSDRSDKAKRIVGRK